MSSLFPYANDLKLMVEGNNVGKSVLRNQARISHVQFCVKRVSGIRTAEQRQSLCSRRNRREAPRLKFQPAIPRRPQSRLIRHSDAVFHWFLLLRDNVETRGRCARRIQLRSCTILR
ncbi:hypothetical protein MRB53_039054 [Persea americana]|nr:hypothetical protein MRB53_039054 [Persea americana]